MIEHDEPLAVPTGVPEEHRRLAVLGIGHREGWWTYLRPEGTTHEERQYLVEVALRDGNGEVVERRLRTEEVLPWALGVADTYGQAALISYREGLQ